MTSSTRPMLATIRGVRKRSLRARNGGRAERGGQTRHVSRAADRALRGAVARPWRADLVDQREPLREDHVLVGQLRDHRRVMQQHEQDAEDPTAKRTAGG